MKRKHIVFVIVAFIVLGLLYLFQQALKPPARQGLGLDRILGEGISKEDIHSVRCYPAGQPDEAVHLVREGGYWLVRSKYDAQASETRADEMLEALTGMGGEVRSSNEDVLSDYAIEDDQVLHLEVMDANGNMIQHLLLGKQGPNWHETFVRQPGSSTVYLVNRNLRQLFGFKGDANEQTDPEKVWVNQVLMRVPKDDITEVELELPYNRIVVQRREKPASDVASATEAAQGPEVEFVLAEPEEASGAPIIPDGFHLLFNSVSNVLINDVAGRGNLKHFGLEVPSATCTVITGDGQKRRLFFGAEVPTLGGGHYCRVENDDLVFKMDKNKISTIFTGLPQLVKLEHPYFNRRDIYRIRVKTPWREVEFVEEDNLWLTAEPAYGYRMKIDPILKVLDSIRRPYPMDVSYEDVPAEITGFDDPYVAVSVELYNGETYKLIYGNEAPLRHEARFACMEGRDDFWVLRKEFYQDAMINLHNIDLHNQLGFNENDIRIVTIEDATGQVVIEQIVPPPPEDEATPRELPYWTFQGMKEKPEEQFALRTMGTVIPSTIIENIHAEGEVSDTGLDDPVITVTAVDKDGDTFELLVGDEAPNTNHYAKLFGQDGILEILYVVRPRLLELTGQLREERKEFERQLEMKAMQESQ
jgi:hypothetical protein